MYLFGCRNSDTIREDRTSQRQSWKGRGEGVPCRKWYYLHLQTEVASPCTTVRYAHTFHTCLATRPTLPTSALPLARLKICDDVRSDPCPFVLIHHHPWTGPALVSAAARKGMPPDGSMSWYSGFHMLMIEITGLSAGPKQGE